jgi:hypothetical protein
MTVVGSMTPASTLTNTLSTRRQSGREQEHCRAKGTETACADQRGA